MGNFAENLNLGNRFRPPPPEGSTCMCRPQEALFQLQRPHLYFSKKKMHFQGQFSSILPKFQLLWQKFWWKFAPETPVSSQKIISGDPRRLISTQIFSSTQRV